METYDESESENRTYLHYDARSEVYSPNKGSRRDNEVEPKTKINRSDVSLQGAAGTAPAGRCRAVHLYADDALMFH